MITAAHIRAARALLGWTADDLAQRAKLGVATVRRAEVSVGALSITRANVEAILRAFEAEGVDFPMREGEINIRRRTADGTVESSVGPVNRTS